MLDLMKPEHAYLFGLLQTDGHFSEYTRNRGKIQLEINERDKDILYKIEEILLKINITCSITHRTRKIKFKKSDKICDSTTYILTIFDWAFREEIKKLGLPVGSKSKIIKPPNVPYSEVDYWRGVIDGDGSLGLTKLNRAFLSLVTASDDLAEEFLNFIEPIIDREKKRNKNHRDNVYNLMILNELAGLVVKELYYDGCLSIVRKYHKSKEVLAWVRPPSVPRKKIRTQYWSEENDNYIMSHSVVESMEFLQRTESSIKNRLSRLKPKYVLALDKDQNWCIVLEEKGEK